VSAEPKDWSELNLTPPERDIKPIDTNYEPKNAKPDKEDEEISSEEEEKEDYIEVDEKLHFSKQVASIHRDLA
jgi:hypothetical protein